MDVMSECPSPQLIDMYLAETAERKKATTAPACTPEKFTPRDSGDVLVVDPHAMFEGRKPPKGAQYCPCCSAMCAVEVKVVRAGGG